MARMSASTVPAILSSPNHHIADRFSFGVNEALIADIGSSRSAAAWLERQFLWTKLSDTRGDAVISWFPHLKDSPGTAWSNLQNRTRGSYDYGRDLCTYTLAMKVVSRRQVREVMADFWSNLFYIPMGEERSFPWRFAYDATIRRNSLGSVPGTAPGDGAPPGDVGLAQQLVQHQGRHQREPRPGAPGAVHRRPAGRLRRGRRQELRPVADRVPGQGVRRVCRVVRP